MTYPISNSTLPSVVWLLARIKFWPQSWPKTNWSSRLCKDIALWNHISRERLESIFEMRNETSSFASRHLQFYPQLLNFWHDDIDQYFYLNFELSVLPKFWLLTFQFATLLSTSSFTAGLGVSEFWKNHVHAEDFFPHFLSDLGPIIVFPCQ